MLYDMIKKRKSFHLYRNTGNESISEAEIQDIYEAYEKFTAFDPDIKTAIRVVPATAKTLGRGAEYAVYIYSETKPNYLINAGYLGEQLDLYLVSKDMGTLWFGIGKPDEEAYEGLSFVIMILIRKVSDPTKYRKDMFKSKRKAVEDIWQGDRISGVTDIVRFAPSACNSQPWFVKNLGDSLEVYRYRMPGKRGIMPAAMVPFYNRIDIGIFLYFIEICMGHEGISFQRTETFVDSGNADEMTKVAVYSIR